MSASSAANSPVVRPPTLIVTRASSWLARVNFATTYPSGEYAVEWSAIDAEPGNLTFGPRLKESDAIPDLGPGTIASLVFG